VSLPSSVSAVLPTDAAQTWETIAPVLPDELYLAGGTGLAVHLSHRKSRDLDFFYHRGAVDLDTLCTRLRRLGSLTVTGRSTGTLNATFSKTKLQFLHADEARAQHQLEPTTRVAGLDVAGIGDILAMKLNVITQRGELRDYFDVMAIEQQTGRTVEDGLGLYVARHRLAPEQHVLDPVVRAFGYLDDVDEDDLIPVSRREITDYWAARQPDIIRTVARMLGRPRHRPPAERHHAPAPGAAPPATSSPTARGGRVWVKPHRRNGKPVRGHYRG